MTWTDLSGAFGYGTKLTSTQMQQLRDNIKAAMDGDAGAPPLQTAGMDNSIVTNAKMADNAIGNAEMANNAIGNAEMLDNAIGNAEMLGDAIHRAELATSTGEVSTSGSAHLTLPGSSYGFYPRVKKNITGTMTARITEADSVTSSYVTQIYLSNHGANTAYAQQRYVTASGETFWIFYLIDKATKKVIANWSAPDHPCFGNDEKIKHPFINYHRDKHLIYVVNPNKDQLKEIRSRIKESFLQTVNEDYELDFSESPEWPNKKVVLKIIDEDYDIKSPQKVIKGKIKQPSYIKTCTLKLKDGI